MFCNWVFPKIGGRSPKWMGFCMENPIKMDDLGVPLFWETSNYPQLFPNRRSRRQRPHEFIWIHGREGVSTAIRNIPSSNKFPLLSYRPMVCDTSPGQRKCFKHLGKFCDYLNQVVQNLRMTSWDQWTKNHLKCVLPECFRRCPRVSKDCFCCGPALFTDRRISAFQQTRPGL